MLENNVIQHIGIDPAGRGLKTREDSRPAASIAGNTQDLKSTQTEKGREINTQQPGREKGKTVER